MESDASSGMNRREFMKMSLSALMSLFFGKFLRGSDVDGQSLESVEVGLSAESMVLSNNPRIEKYLSQEHVYGPVDKENYAERIRFINKYRALAVSEQAIYHIPASITLAQGILESKSGASDLAQYNNFFGIKCRTAGVDCDCLGHFIKDDPGPSYFTKYKSPWFGFRGHSKFIANDPKQKYKDCFASKKYNDWAFALKRAGYASDQNYASKLIQIIFQYKLFVYDEEIPGSVVLPK